MTDYPVQNPINDLVQNTVNRTKNALKKAEEWKLPLKFKILFPIIQLLPVIFIVLSFCAYRVPEFRWYTLLLVILALVPTIAVYFFLMTRSKNKKRRAVAIILCTVYLPISLILSLAAFPCSKTTDIEDYHLFDSGVKHKEVYELFPQYAYTSYYEVQPDNTYQKKSADAEYYYNYSTSLDGVCYDISAEWTLPFDEFKEEVERIASRWPEARVVERDGCKYLILNEIYGFPNFITIFSYNEETQRVGYIAVYDYDLSDEITGMLGDIV